MNSRFACLPMLLAAVSLACVTEPEFTYPVAAGPALAQAGSLAADPRQLVWTLPGKHSENPGAFRHAALEELRAKGFAIVKASEADLWLDVIVLGPERHGAAAPPVEARGSQMGGGGMNPGGRAGGRNRGQAAPDAVPAAAPPEQEERTVMVKLLSRSDEQPVWSGTLVIPGRKAKGEPYVWPEEWMHRLLGPLPARDGAKK